MEVALSPHGHPIRTALLHAVRRERHHGTSVPVVRLHPHRAQPVQVRVLEGSALPIEHWQDRHCPQCPYGNCGSCPETTAGGW